MARHYTPPCKWPEIYIPKYNYIYNFGCFSFNFTKVPNAVNHLTCFTCKQMMVDTIVVQRYALLLVIKLLTCVYTTTKRCEKFYIMVIVGEKVCTCLYCTSGTTIGIHVFNRCVYFEYDFVYMVDA